jgi:hypothetical protein
LTRLLPPAAALALVAAGGASAAQVAVAAPPPAATVVCHNRAQTASTDPIHTRSHAGDRLVLGRVWLPERVLSWPPVANAGAERFLKHGIVVSAGTPVTLTVPPSARRVYGLTFGGSTGPSLTIAPCPSSEGPATAWPGGYLARRPACVPVIVRADGRSARAMLSLGRACA